MRREMPFMTDRVFIDTNILLYAYDLMKIAKPLSPAEARATISRYLVWHIEVNTPNSILRASEIQERYRLSFWDALIVASAAKVGATILYTEDLNHGQIIERVRIINPFLMATSS